MLIAKDKDLSIKVKMHQTFFFYFYHYLPHTCWVDMIYLTCRVFLKSPWWLVSIFCIPTPLNISWTINICLKYFMTATKTLRPLPTYLMYGPSTNPLDSGRKLNAHKMLRKCLRCLLNVFWMFKLRAVFGGITHTNIPLNVNDF